MKDNFIIDAHMHIGPPGVFFAPKYNLPSATAGEEAEPPQLKFHNWTPNTASKQ